MKRSYNDRKQMTVLQKSDPLSIQCEYGELNTEDEESLQFSDEDEENDKNLLKI